NLIFGSQDGSLLISEATEKFTHRHGGYPKFSSVYRIDGEGKETSCGKREVYHSPPKNTPNEPMPKIVGGVPAPYGAYPWTVHIENLNFEGFEHACGGTIISEFFIVTAAHCLHGLSYREVRVKVGDFDTKLKDPAEKTYETETWKVHPDFQKGGYYKNDIAVLKVKPFLGKGITFNEFISPACLPLENGHYPAGTWCYVSGWGLTKSNALYPSNLLQAATVPLIPKRICQNKRVYGSRRFQEGMMCAGYLQGKIDACGGDSGGPLVCDVGGNILIENYHTKEIKQLIFTYFKSMAIRANYNIKISFALQEASHYLE
ncbi:Transmembrane protease serine 3, partial [Armadillidium nasatum]